MLAATIVHKAGATIARMTINDYTTRFSELLGDSTQRMHQLAAALGISYQAVAKVKRGTTKMLRADHNCIAAQFFGVDPVWLATGERRPEISDWPLSADLLRALRAASASARRQAENAARAVLDLPHVPAQDFQTADDDKHGKPQRLAA